MVLPLKMRNGSGRAKPVLRVDQRQPPQRNTLSVAAAKAGPAVRRIIGSRRSPSAGTTVQLMTCHAGEFGGGDQPAVGIDADPGPAAHVARLASCVEGGAGFLAGAVQYAL